MYAFVGISGRRYQRVVCVTVAQGIDNDSAAVAAAFAWAISEPVDSLDSVQIWDICENIQVCSLDL